MHHYEDWPSGCEGLQIRLDIAVWWHCLELNEGFSVPTRPRARREQDRHQDHSHSRGKGQSIRKQAAHWEPPRVRLFSIESIQNHKRDRFSHTLEHDVVPKIASHFSTSALDKAVTLGMILRQRHIHLAERLFNRIHHHVRPADEVSWSAYGCGRCRLNISAVM